MSKKGKRVSAHSVTRILFVTTQIAALGWVSVSYLIAVYSILGVNVLKVVENIFEHNDGPVFGKNNTEKQPKRDC